MKGIPHSTSEQVQSPRRKSGKPATSKAMLLVRALAEDCGVDLRKPIAWLDIAMVLARRHVPGFSVTRSEEHTSELQSPDHLVCRLLLEKKKAKMDCRLRDWYDH